MFWLHQQAFFLGQRAANLNGAHIVPHLKFAGAPFKTPQQSEDQKCTTGEDFSL